MEAVARQRILLVEDEVNVRTVVKACLENLGGWDVLLASSGAEGLAIALAEQPDAILLDGMMPEMDGVEFLQRLQTNPEISGIPVVFLTANPMLLQPSHYQELGVCGAIAKPFNPITLPGQVAMAFGWPPPKTDG